MDVAKTRLQVMAQGAARGAPRPGLGAALASIVRNDGVSGLYAGLSASLMRQAIYGTARLGLHREFSDAMKRSQGGGSLPAWKSVASSMVRRAAARASAAGGVWPAAACARARAPLPAGLFVFAPRAMPRPIPTSHLQASGALASVVGNPFDISMVRMQADSLKPAAERRGYKHVFDALLRISREEGLPSLWRGFEPTVARAIAMNVGMMATYDIVKEAIVKVNGDNFSTSLASSAGAALACVVTSLPFDLIKTRLQNMKPDAAGVYPYRGVLDCAGKVAAVEGPLAFWTGFGAYYGRTAPHAMIILLSLEQINKLYTRAFVA